MPEIKPLSIYIHVPFCEKKCPYCDFYSVKSGDFSAFFDQINAEIGHFSAKKSEYLVQTIYFGGGTPSLVDAKFIAKTLETIKSTFNVAEDAEISIECNPNSISCEKLQIYRENGVNRISIGVQSFKNRTLRVLGRVHNAKQAKTAIKMAREYFENVSIDLIHSVPGCTPKIPRGILKNISHVSAYCLISDKYKQVSDEKSIREQQNIERILARNGIFKYEVSNFARVGFECRHNLVYWRCGEWLGFGPSAESHFNEPWSDADRIMLGLRTVQGVALDLLASKRKEVDNLVAMGFLEIKDEMVRCTGRGFLLLNQILLKLL